MEDIRMTELQAYISEKIKDSHPESHLIAVLHRAQDLYGYLKVDVMDAIAESMSIPTAHVWGVATFYHYFALKPKGKYVISVCLGTACYVKGAGKIVDTLKKVLGIDFGQTTEDKVFTLQETRCLGACGLAPVMMINDKIYGELTPEKTEKILKTLRDQGNTKKEG